MVFLHNLGGSFFRWSTARVSGKVNGYTLLLGPAWYLCVREMGTLRCHSFLMAPQCFLLTCVVVHQKKQGNMRFGGVHLKNRCMQLLWCHCHPLGRQLKWMGWPNAPHLNASKTPIHARVCSCTGLNRVLQLGHFKCRPMKNAGRTCHERQAASGKDLHSYLQIYPLITSLLQRLVCVAWTPKPTSTNRVSNFFFTFIKTWQSYLSNSQYGGRFFIFFYLLGKSVILVIQSLSRVNLCFINHFTRIWLVIQSEHSLPWLSGHSLLFFFQTKPTTLSHYYSRACG